MPPESSDSEDDAVEEDSRERTDEEEIDNSNEDMSANVTSLIDLTGKDWTVWQSTPPPRTRTQQHNIVRSRAKPTNLPGVLTFRRPESTIVDQRRKTGIIPEIYQFRVTHECCESENVANA